MVFSSYIFMFVFLPVTLAGYFLLARFKRALWQKLFLIAASLVFYGYFNPAYLLILIASVLVNYALAWGMTKAARGKKALLALGILFNIGMLGYFKYTDFLIENVNAIFGASFALKHILLPLGISFFTFQQFSYLIAVYQGESRSEGFADYALFVVFFPQLVAGPIVLYGEMMPQFTDETRRRPNAENLASGAYVFCVGLFMKLVCADSAALFADNGFAADSLSMAAAWLTSLAYTVQLFFDFGGYAAMAIGLGKLFNIDLPENFDRPYRAVSISDFWRRWHITLGRALSTYVYRPLGGNRKGLTRTCINLLLTFLVSGLWHGASWTFVLWGALHGVLCVAERLIGEKRLEKIPRALRCVLTFLIVNALWVLFRAESFPAAATVYRGMLAFGNIGLAELASLAYDGIIGFPKLVRIAYAVFYVGALLVLSLVMRAPGEQVRAFRPTRKKLWLAAALFVLSVLHMGRESIFIYFNF